jgi:phosphohistidine phosphatase
MQGVSRGLKALGLRPDAILHSPLVRARETAQIVAETLGLQDRLHEEPGLACGCRLRDLQQMLDDRAHLNHILLVGHEPDFSTLTSTLIGGGNVRMKKASLACVDAPGVAPGAGELRWLWEAPHLALLGEKG